MKIIKSRPFSLPEAKEMLEERKKDGELEYEPAQASEHADKFAHMKSAEASRIVKELAESGIDRDTAVKIVDVRPKHPETLKAILLKNKVEMSDEELTSLLKKIQL